MTRRDHFDALFREFLAGRLTRRDVVTRAASLGAGAALLGGGGAGASPLYAPGALRPLAQATPKRGGTLKIGMQADPTGLDPHKQSLTALWHVVEHIYNRLTKPMPDLTIAPELAESWTISPDGLTYTFKLRTGVKFHNGRPMVAADVKYSYERLVDPKTASTSAADLDSMKTIEAPNDATVVITLKAPDASFLSSLAGQSTIVIPKEVVEKNGDLSQVAVGTGPFKFKEYVPNTHVVLERNSDYWEPGLPYVDGLELIIAADDTVRTTAVVSGTVDIIEYTPWRDVDHLQKDPSITLAGDANTNIRMIGFNLRKAPFNNIKVRQAIAAVVDRGPILDAAVFGKGTPVETIFPPSY